MTTQDLRAILLAEHKRDIHLMWIGYSIIAGLVLIVLGLIVWLFVSMHVSFTGTVNSLGDQTSGVPAYVKLILPFALLLSAGYAVYSFLQLKKRPETIETFVKHIENGTRVLSITDVKNYRIKIPLYFVNYHTGAVQSFAVVLEGVKKGFVLPVPVRHTDEVKDLLNENS
jgi:hypothetical protein